MKNKKKLEDIYITQIIFIAILVMNFICIAFQPQIAAGSVTGVISFAGFIALHTMLFFYGSRKRVYDRILLIYWTLIVTAFFIRIGSLYGDFTEWTIRIFSKILILLYPLYASMDVGNAGRMGADMVVMPREMWIFSLEITASVFFMYHYWLRRKERLG